MNLLNLIEDASTGFENLRALIQAVQNSQDAVLNLGGEPVTLTYPEARFMYGKYKAFLNANRQQEFIDALGDPVKFDQHMRQLRQLIDKQKNFRGSVPGQRGVQGDVPVGVAEQTVEEIAMQDPGNPTKETAGKINWERMIKDYMANKPFTEFEFGGDRPLTLYRSQIYAILKDFGRMKPQQKVNIILNTFGDKYATVDYIDRLRSKGLMPKKVPAYVAPGTEPVSPGQMDLPGMPTPKIREGQAQKKNSNEAELDSGTARSPKVQRAFQLARARQAAAGTDIEAFVKDEIEKSEAAQAEIEELRRENERQDQQIQQLAKKVRQQDAEISQPEPAVAAKPEKSEPTAEPKADKEPEKKAEPAKQTEPEKKAEPAKQKDEPRAEPAPSAEPKPRPKKKPKVDQPKPDDTQIQRPEPVEVPDNVLQFPTPAQRQGKKGKKAAAAAQLDPVQAATMGVDLSDFGQAVGMNEDNHELHVGDPVIIQGNVEFNGKTGDVAGFGRDKHFVIVDLYNFGKHAFHSSNVVHNAYADQEDYLEEMQTKLDRFNVNQPTPGGTNKQREQFLDARERLFRQMANATPGEKEAIRMKIADLEGKAQSQGIKIREAGEFNRAGYNAIKSVHDWAEKMRVMRELQKDIALMADPESKEAIQQRIGDLLKIGIKQGYLKEAGLPDKAMNLLRSLKKPAQAQAQTVQQLDPAKQAELDAWAQDFQRNVAGPMGRQVVPPQQPIDLNVPAEPARRRGRPSNAQRAQEREEYETIKRKIAQLDELLKMKEQIDKLFVKAQKVRGGIYPGLQADIEAEELYPVPEQNFDKEYTDLKDKYTRDLTALQKFLAMKKAVYREGQERVNESASLVRLQRARQRLAQQLGQGVAEGSLNELSPGLLQRAAQGAKVKRDQAMDPEVHSALGGGYMNPLAKHYDTMAKKFGDKAVKAGQKDAVKKIASPSVMRKIGLQGMAEGYDDDEEDCHMCSGTGEGRHESETCSHCRGTGVEPVEHNDYDDFDIPDSDPRDYGDEESHYEKFVRSRGLEETQTDYQKRRQRERDADAGKPVAKQRQPKMTDYQKRRAQDKKDMELGEQQMCPECGGPSFSDMLLAEKHDACYNKVRSRYKVWPSAYASGALVQCRKKGAANWGNKGKK